MRLGSPLGVLFAALVLASCDSGGNQVQGRPPPDPNAPRVVSVDPFGTDANPFFAVIVNPAAIESPAEYLEIARETCASVQICVIGMWDDPRYKPAGVPISNTQRVNQVFSYGKNEQTGTETTNWNCQRFPEYRDQPRSCFPLPFGPGMGG